MPKHTENGTNVEKLLADLKAVVRDGQQLLLATARAVRERAVTPTDHYVRERPYETLGVAFSIGLMVGLVFSGASRRRHVKD